MKKVYLTVMMVVSLTMISFTQNNKQQKILTSPDEGFTISTQIANQPAEINKGFITGGSRNLEINWQYADPSSIGSKIKVSGSSGYTFNSWWLNDERVSLYENTAVPLWESPIISDWEYPIDMTPNGAYLTVGFDSVVQVYETATQQLVWEKITDAGIIGAVISEDGSMVYVVENQPSGMDKSNVSAYEVGEEDPLWQTSFSGVGTAFAASGDRSVLAYCQYSGINTMWLLDAETGEVIFDAFYRNQYPPSLSYDGNLVVAGDYSGYAYLYEFDEEAGSYAEKWNFKVGGGGTSAWVVGMGISADGSAVAIGTLVFLSGGGFDGEIYLFNSYSPEPLWVFEHTGDEVCSVSLSDDGSLIAAAGYGPMDHTKPDFYLFRKESNDPIYTLSTPGSFFNVDISGDGMLCSVTGKAVHARVMGSGGLLYNIDSNPGGGTISGTIESLSGNPIGQVKVHVEGLEDYFAYSQDDGSYELKYVPAGTYQVVAEKVGFYPVDIMDVVVNEGETTTLDISMEPTGDPPTSLSASHGAGYTVMLSWLPPELESVEGYHVYRKEIMQEMFPEEPIATLEPDVVEYEDTDVKPLTTYYYAVTAMIEEGVQSPYSNIAEGWMAQGFVIDDISVYYGSTPTIDGTMEPGEWDDAFEMDASDFLGTYDNMPNPVGSVMMYYKTNPDMTELYVACINQNDTVLEDHDEVALYIDDNNDGSYPPNTDNSEGNYWAAYYAAGNELKYRPIYNTGGVGEVIFLENPQLEVSDELGYIVYEFMVPIGDDADWKITPNDENQSGLFSFTLDDPTNFDGYWPAQNQQIFYPSAYGTITFGAEDLVPGPPQNTSIWWNSATPPVIIIMEWEQPNINDFDHFNVYINETGTFELLTETIGTQLYYYTDNVEYTTFYITTVDKAGQESDPSDYLIFDITIGIYEQEWLNEASVYPNPAAGAANISFNIAERGFYDVEIHNAQGRLICNLHSGILLKGQHVFRWNAKSEGLVPGIYFLSIGGNEGRQTQKIVIAE